MCASRAVTSGARIGLRPRQRGSAAELCELFQVRVESPNSAVLPQVAGELCALSSFLAKDDNYRDRPMSH